MFRVRLDVRVEVGPTARRQARAGEKVPRTTGPGARDTPLGLGLNEG